MHDIKVRKNTTELYQNQSLILTIKLGTEEISSYGFQTVDHIVEELLHCISEEGAVSIHFNTIEGQMVGRKLEDRLSRPLNHLEIKLSSI
jgi:hypothetical protein